MTESADSMTNLQYVSISDHDLNVFDELSHQCNAVVYSSNSQQQKLPSTIGLNNFDSSYLMPTTMMNDYERRFQRSLQKLTVPSWYTDTTPSLNISGDSKQSIISTSLIPWKTDYRETNRVPEIIHVQRPHSYRSCLSSLATSPSPSVHSWHPTHMMDGMNLSFLRPSSSRRRNRYEKGIERVSRSSRWYQPTQFIPNKTTNGQTGIIKISTSTKHKQQSTKNNHYDAPKLHSNDACLISKPNYLVTNGTVENIMINEQNNNVITNDKQQDNHISSNESQIVPLADTQVPLSRIELEDIVPEKYDNQSLSMENNTLISSIINLPLFNEQMDANELLERAADDLVQSVLTDILLLNNFDDDDDKNSGVRELSDDENGLRELDENDMSDTDEFIVFARNAEISDYDQIPNTPRCGLNRLYTFSRTNNNNSIRSSKQTTSNQNSPRSILEEDVKTINSQSNSNTEQSFDKLFHSSPIYHSHIEKPHINLDQFIDRVMCPSSRQLSPHQSDKGVNEETARIGRLLLESIPTPFIENVNNLSSTSTSIGRILKSTRFVISDHENNYKSPREDYHRNQLRMIEYDGELNAKIRLDSAYSSNQERINIPQSMYEPLSDCYSGYSFIQSDFLTPNISSLQSTTDEAYESEPTTMSSSIATATHVHPELEHEFEFPSPPPPVPDRRLKPAYLKLSLPTTKPPLTKQDNIDSNGYTVVHKTKPLPLTAIRQFVTSTADNSTSSSTRTMSSRNYCGSIPVSNEVIQPYTNSTPIQTNGHSKTKTKEKRTSKALSCLHPSTTDNNNKRNTITKSSGDKIKIKKQKLITDFDEATNGLAIRIPAPTSPRHDSTNKQNLNRTSTPLSIKQANGMTKNRQRTDNIKSDRLPLYETSV